MVAEAKEKQGDFLSYSSNYRAAIADNNALVKEWQAQDALERGIIKEDFIRREVSHIQSRQVAAFAANGIKIEGGEDTLYTGTVEAHTFDTEYIGEIDALTTRISAQREAFLYQHEANNLRAGAEFERYAGKMGRDAAYYDAQLERFSGDKAKESGERGYNIHTENADAALRAGLFQAGTTLVTGLSNVFSQAGGRT